MRCPFCSCESTRVVETRLQPPGDVLRRRRECVDCGNRFTTRERAEEPAVTVVKRDGRRERFDRQKLLRGLGRAASKRPVSDEQLEALAEAIAREARRGGPEARAGQIGDLAERGLARLDPVAAIQFASVYRNLADLDELAAVVRRFKEQSHPGADQLALDGPSDPSPDPSDPSTNIGLSPAGQKYSHAETRRANVRQP